MRVLAEVLFWMGRLETVVLAMLLLHSLIIWCWRREALVRWLAVAWLMFFTVLSIALFPGLLSRANDGTGYVIAHLRGRIWPTGDEALSNILLRWRNLWLPIYVPWVGIWLVGLAGISVVLIVKEHLPCVFKA